MNSIYKSVVNKFTKSFNDANINFNLLIAGRTGVGKSSLINSLLNSQTLTTNQFESETKTALTFEHSIDNIKLLITDTPGFCDDLPEKGNDKKYIELIQARKINNHCLLYVTELDAPRISSDEKRTLKILSDNLASNLWSNAIVVFTFSDRVPQSQFDDVLMNRIALFKKEISQYNKYESSNIGFIPVTNSQSTLPSGLEWKNNLYIEIINQMVIRPSIKSLQLRNKQI
ncbi:MAG: GTPase RsgA [Gammaproteobacteria bacterium]|nr:GTPase RsgA [Gammaproteobacteria bacterium]